MGKGSTMKLLTSEAHQSRGDHHRSVLTLIVTVALAGSAAPAAATYTPEFASANIEVDKSAITPPDSYTVTINTIRDQMGNPYLSSSVVIREIWDGAASAEQIVNLPPNLSSYVLSATANPPTAP
jgi:hypothetical protein